MATTPLPLQLTPDPVFRSFGLDTNAADPQVGTLRLMVALANQFSESAYIRFTVNQILTDARVTHDDLLAATQALVAYVRAKVIFTRDNANVETLISPVNMLHEIQTSGVTRGDCDDHVLLLNTMLTSIGIDAVPVGVQYRVPEWNHVVSGVLTDGRMVLYDTCAKGDTLPSYTSILLP